jgi:DNA-binding IclR family transcriptional regulator
MAGSGSVQQLSQLLDMFGDERWLVTAEDVMATLGVPRTTAYRTVRALTETGFLDRISDEGYALGPRILQLYRQVQLGDPLLQVARPVAVALASSAPAGSIVLLCRYYRSQAMCVHQEMAPGPQDRVSYEVGRPMALYRGSSSKAVLAALDRARLKKLYENDAAGISEAELGGTREEFLAALKAIRRAGYCVARGEVDTGRIGISSPLSVTRFGLAGCISLVLSEVLSNELDVSRAIVQVTTAAHDIAHRLETWRP